MKNNTALVIEYVWMVCGIISFIIGLIETINNGIGKSYLFFVISALSFAVYSLRRSVRKNNKESL